MGFVYTIRCESRAGGDDGPRVARGSLLVVRAPVRPAARHPATGAVRSESTAGASKVRCDVRVHRGSALMIVAAMLGLKVCPLFPAAPASAAPAAVTTA